MSNTTCKHPKTKVRETTETYRPINARSPNPGAAGNITIIEQCDCGAVRLTNSNAGQTETTGWHLPEPPRKLRQWSAQEGWHDSD